MKANSKGVSLKADLSKLTDSIIIHDEQRI